MNAPTITMEVEEARDKLRAYEKMPQWVTTSEEHKVLMYAYQAMADGHSLLTLESAFRQTDVDKHGRPRLGIAPAHHKYCIVTPLEECFEFTSKVKPDDWIWEATVEVPCSKRRAGKPGSSLVPLVPIDALRRISRPLDHYWILWEVDQWSEITERAQSPVDPYLLYRIGADLWVIVYEWMLTDLERMVVNGRGIQ